MARDGSDASVFPEGTTLRACGPEGVAALARFWHEARYPARAMIVSEDDTDDDVFFILAGRARAATFTNSGREVLLSELRPGEAFGIFAAIDGRPRSTNVLAVEDSRIARMSAANFRKVLFGHDDVNRAFLTYMVDLVRSLSSRVTSVTTLSAEERLIAELLRLAEGNRTGDDTAVIEPVPTQHEMATLLFSQREAIARELSKLKKARLIERQGRTLVVRSLSGLRARLERD